MLTELEISLILRSLELVFVPYEMIRYRSSKTVRLDGYASIQID